MKTMENPIETIEKKLETSWKIDEQGEWEILATQCSKWVILVAKTKEGSLDDQKIKIKYIWQFVKMSVPGFVDKSQFHACRLMFAFEKTWPTLMTWKRGNSSLPLEIFLKPQESANARRFSFAVAGTISLTVCLCVCASLNAMCFLTCLLINAVSLL